MSETISEEMLTLPPSGIWNHVSKISILEDKPIMLDYWLDSTKKEVIIGIRENDEKLLVKNAEEYTSPIAKIYKIEEVFIICTENSIYITSSDIEKRKIS
tara:strand:+ start:103 stop:402 length:300 start_codon:yes stop_codon:yes gene_type:complete